MIYFELVTSPLFDGHKIHGNKMFDPKCGFHLLQGCFFGMLVNAVLYTIRFIEFIIF
jgi:hypothetical protein